MANGKWQMAKQMENGKWHCPNLTLQSKSQKIRQVHLSRQFPKLYDCNYSLFWLLLKTDHPCGKKWLVKR
jgi:hypothetical protein